MMNWGIHRKHSYSMCNKNKFFLWFNDDLFALLKVGAKFWYAIQKYYWWIWWITFDSKVTSIHIFKQYLL